MQKSFWRALVVVPWIGCLATLNIDGSLPARRMPGAEQRCLKTITVLHTAETSYWQRFGQYASSLADLGITAPTDYQFTLQARHKGYVIHAEPLLYNKSGWRTFYSNETLVIREHWGPEPATAESYLLEPAR